MRVDEVDMKTGYQEWIRDRLTRQDTIVRLWNLLIDQIPIHDRSIRLAFL